MSSSNDLLQASSGKSSKGSRGSRPRLFLKDHCQADQCLTDLAKLRFYNRRNHICLMHQKAPQFSLRNKTAPVRFCQRCAVSHHLEEFDGAKRSCRQKLEKFNARRRKNNATTATASSESSLHSQSLSELSSELHDLDSLDLDLAIGELLPVGEDFLLAETVQPLPSSPTASAAAVAEPQTSTANSINCNERVCCTTADAECMCKQLDSDESISLADANDNNNDGNDDGVISSSNPCPTSAPSNAVAAATPTAAPTADCDDPNACISGPSDELDEQTDEGNNIAQNVAAAAKLEAEFAALQATDTAMYAMLVHQQIMQASLLLTTTANALLMQRAASVSAPSQLFSRKESFGEISPMVM